MKFGRLQNGALVSAPQPLSIGGTDTFTNDVAVMRAMGYKPIAETAAPAAREGFVWVGAWTETENAITRAWAEEAVTEAATEDDYISALEELGVSMND